MTSSESHEQISKEKLSKIKMLILDVDGILTDCRIWYDSAGEWRRFFSIRDGVGIKRLIESGYQLGIITGSRSTDIRERAKTLGIQYFFEGALNKMPAYEEIKTKTKFSDFEIAYMGDDFFDIPLLKQVGFAATVMDAMDEVKPHVDYIAKRPAGNGAAREVCDFIWRHGAFAGSHEKAKG